MTIPPVSAPFNPSNAGISGLQTLIDSVFTGWLSKKHSEAEKTIEVAFDDLKSLMAMAREMVAFSQKLQARLATNSTENELSQFKVS